MSWFSSLFSKAAAEPIEAVGNVLDSLFTSDEERLDKNIIMQRLAQQPALAQAEITKVQAQHRSVFVAGARPFLMWVCGFAFLQAFIINPNIEWIAELMGKEVTPPALQLEIMLELTLAMLGLAGLRTFEKLQGKTK